MKRTKILAAVVAAAAITASLITTAFAAPAISMNNLLNQYYGYKGTSQPAKTTWYSYQPSQPATTGTTGTGKATTPTTGTTGTGKATTPTSGTTTKQSTPTGSTSGSMSSDESRMVNLVNQDRADAGLPALKFDSGLRSGALAHSKDMSQNNYFSHTSPTQGDFSARLNASGVQHSAAGENIALNGSVDGAEAAFMNSSGHRANILSSTYTRVGIGIVYNQSKGGYYITQWFAK